MHSCHLLIFMEFILLAQTTFKALFIIILIVINVIGSNQQTNIMHL